MSFFYEKCDQFDMKDMIAVRDILPIFSAFTEEEIISMLHESGTMVYKKDRIINYPEGEVIFFGNEYEFDFFENINDVLECFITRTELIELKKEYPIAIGNIVAEHRTDILISDITSLRLKLAECQNVKQSYKEALDNAECKIKRINNAKRFSDEMKESWVEYLKVAVKLAVHCVENSKALDLPMTKEYIEQLAAKLGLEPLGRDPLNAFRDSMPVKYIQGHGRPKIDKK